MVQRIGKGKEECRKRKRVEIDVRVEVYESIDTPTRDSNTYLSLLSSRHVTQYKNKPQSTSR